MRSQNGNNTAANEAARPKVRVDLREDLYAVLGVAQNASEEAIHRAYREKIREVHSDKDLKLAKKRALDEQRLLMDRAYVVLKDPITKKVYDNQLLYDDQVPGTKVDHYAILGVSDSASTEEINQAFVNKRRPWYEEGSKKIQNAYEVLSNPDRRSKYDQKRAEANHYAILGVSDSASTEEIYRAFDGKKRQHEQGKENKEEEGEGEAKSRKIQHAYEVFKDPDKRRIYDQLRSAYLNQEQPSSPVPFDSGWYHPAYRWSRPPEAQAASKPESVFVDYYAVLGLSLSATTEEIKQAFENKLHQWEEKGEAGEEARAELKAMTDAFELLCDPDKRKEYDQKYVQEEYQYARQVKERFRGRPEMKDKDWPTDESLRYSYTCQMKQQHAKKFFGIDLKEEEYILLTEVIEDKFPWFCGSTILWDDSGVKKTVLMLSLARIQDYMNVEKPTECEWQGLIDKLHFIHEIFLADKFHVIKSVEALSVRKITEKIDSLEKDPNGDPKPNLDELTRNKVKQLKVVRAETQRKLQEHTVAFLAKMDVEGFPTDQTKLEAQALRLKKEMYGIALAVNKRYQKKEYICDHKNGIRDWLVCAAYWLMVAIGTACAGVGIAAVVVSQRVRDKMFHRTDSQAVVRSSGKGLRKALDDLEKPAIAPMA